MSSTDAQIWPKVSFRRSADMPRDAANVRFRRQSAPVFSLA
jgi:hypothetical protein